MTAINGDMSGDPALEGLWNFIHDLVHVNPVDIIERPWEYGRTLSLLLNSSLAVGFHQYLYLANLTEEADLNRGNGKDNVLVWEDWRGKNYQ